jgi:hypothetical protein
VVLAPVDVADCYRLTVEAFNLAESLRCPVFIATNKEIAMTRETVDLDTVDLPADSTRRGRLNPSTLFSPSPHRPMRPHRIFCPSRPVGRWCGRHRPPTAQTATSPPSRAIIAAAQRGCKAKVENAAWPLFSTYYGPQTPTPSSSPTGSPPVPPATRWRQPRKTVNPWAAGVENPLAGTGNGDRMPPRDAPTGGGGNEPGAVRREIRRVRAGIPISFLGQMNGELITPEPDPGGIAHG